MPKTDFANFIPTIWSENFNRELEKALVFNTHVTRKFEGDVASKGDSVKILTAGKPTIWKQPRNTADGDINGPETVQGTDIIMYIDQIRYFNYKIGKVDKLQAVNGLEEEWQRNAALGVANEIDKYIALVTIPDADNRNRNSTHLAKIKEVTKTATYADTAANLASIFDEVKEEAEYKNIIGQLEAIITPKELRLLRSYYIATSTDNVEDIKNGVIGRYNDIALKMSNNVARKVKLDAIASPTDEQKAASTTITSLTGDFLYLLPLGAIVDHTVSGTKTYYEAKAESVAYGERLIQVKTSNAVAYVQPLTHHEAYRPEKQFSDAVKGFTLFDAMVINPDEIIELKLKYATS